MPETMICYAIMRKERYGTYYMLSLTAPTRLTYARWRGPYRDATDAENAAEDEAKLSHYVLEWTNA